MNRFYCLVPFLISTSVFAGTGSGKITAVSPSSIGSAEVLIINVETIAATPACNTTSSFAMSNTNNPQFKATQAAALSALIMGSKVTIRGKNTCDALNNAETFTYMCIGDTPC